MKIQSSEHILLTGAGFTKNFGAPLAIEMWAEIFNHKEIQAQSRIRKLMLDNFDYESIYTSIIEDENYKEEEKKAINIAVMDVYEDMDTILRKYNYPRNPFPTKLDNFMQLIWRFAEKENKSFIFTLNQDLFFEREYYERRVKGVKLFIPGIKNNSNSISDYSQLPNEEGLNSNKRDILSVGKFFYIKLHGSCNWKSFDGTQKMVIGRGKAEQIVKEPLLNYYFDVFKNVLFQKKRRLLIVGYGFGDEHINNIIAEAVRCHELMIYIISPDLPEDLKKKLIDKPKYGKYLWQGISGYFQNRLIEIFPEDSNNHTQASKNLIKNFLSIDINKD